jgi:ADP-heptose:LPS heptosyltransferase
MMELLRNAEFLSSLAGTAYQSAIPRLPRLCVLPANLQIEGSYFIVFPGASWAGRQWPVEQFVEVLVALQRHHGWTPVLCGASNEAALCQAIVRAATVNCIILAGKTDLGELVEVIRGARLLISNETSAVHVAAAVGTPAVCVLGGGHYGRFMPYPEVVFGRKPLVAYHPMPCFNCNWRCSIPHRAGEAAPCLVRVSVAQVLHLAHQAVEQTDETKK